MQTKNWITFQENHMLRQKKCQIQVMRTLTVSSPFFPFTSSSKKRKTGEEITAVQKLRAASSPVLSAWLNWGELHGLSPVFAHPFLPLGLWLLGRRPRGKEGLLLIWHCRIQSDYSHSKISPDPSSPDPSSPDPSSDPSPDSSSDPSSDPSPDLDPCCWWWWRWSMLMLLQIYW